VKMDQSQLFSTARIYNFQELKPQLEARGHSFKTHSDTEAIVHAYEEFGPACLNQLRGMFALAYLG
jgi:asparagine synthase (glutamine-hydrolysing)